MSDLTPPPGLPSSSPKTSRLKNTLRAFQFRNYRLYFSGQLISVIGTWMQTVAQSWLVYQLSHSPVLLGLVGFAGQIPVFVLGPWAGIVIDQFPKRRLIIFTQGASLCLALAMAVLTLAGVVQVWEILLLALLLGVVNALDVPARQAFVIEMVGRADLMNAIALNSSMVNGARILGPAIAGVLVASVGEGWCFLINAISYVAVLAGLLMMDIVDKMPTSSGHSALNRFKEGFLYAKSTVQIRSLLLLLGLVSVMGMPYSVLMPLFADAILHGGPKGLGILMGATGVGALLGAVTLAMRTRLEGLEKIIPGAAVGFGAFLILFSSSHLFWLSVLLLVPAAYFFMMQMAATNTLVQSIVPDALRGRVMSFYSMMFLGMAPFGSLLSGVLAKFIGASYTVAIGGAVCCVGGFLFRHSLIGAEAMAVKSMAQK